MRFFPAYRPPVSGGAVAEVFRNHRKDIVSEITHVTRMQSNDALAVIADDLDLLAFQVDRGNQKLGNRSFTRLVR